MTLNNSADSRWLMPDPTGGDVTNPQSLPDFAGIFDNRYAYALNNPTSLTDPLGLQQCKPGQACPPPHPPACTNMDCVSEYYGHELYPGMSDANNPLYSGECTIDGVTSSCAQAIGLLMSGSAVLMPGPGYVPAGGDYRGSGCARQGDNVVCPPYDVQLGADALEQPSIPTVVLQTRVFVSTLGQNFIDEFKKGGCFNQFLDEIATGDHSPPGAAPEDVVRSTGENAAAVYALSRGLSYPLKSSVFRGILNLTDTAAGAVALVPADYSLGKGFINEMRSYLSGGCK